MDFISDTIISTVSKMVTTFQNHVLNVKCPGEMTGNRVGESRSFLVSCKSVAAALSSAHLKCFPSRLFQARLVAARTGNQSYQFLSH